MSYSRLELLKIEYDKLNEEFEKHEKIHNLLYTKMREIRMLISNEEKIIKFLEKKNKKSKLGLLNALNL